MLNTFGRETEEQDMEDHELTFGELKAKVVRRKWDLADDI